MTRELCFIGCDYLVSGKHSPYCFTEKCTIKVSENGLSATCPNHKYDYTQNFQNVTAAFRFLEKHIKDFHY